MLTITKGSEAANMPLENVNSRLSHEARGEEAVKPCPERVRIWEVNGQGAEVAVGGDELGPPEHVGCCNRLSRERRIAREQRRDLRLAFFRLHRTDAVD